MSFTITLGRDVLQSGNTFHIRKWKKYPLEGDMMRKSATMLILGATGRQGGATARALAADGRSVRALVRDQGSDQARDLASLGVELVTGDFGDIASLEQAMVGVQGVFAVLPSSADAGYGMTDADETRFGIAVVDAAERAGVSHLIYSSTIGASPDLGLGHYASKWHIEQHLRHRGVPYTIVRPAPFMELLLFPHFGLCRGVVTFFGAPDQIIQFVAVADLGVIVARLLVDSSHHLGATIDIASDALSGNEIAACIATATGRLVPYEQVPAEAAAQNPMIARLLEAMTDGKLQGHADIPALRALHPGLLTFRQWLAAGHAKAIMGLLPALEA